METISIFYDRIWDSCNYRGCILFGGIYRNDMTLKEISNKTAVKKGIDTNRYDLRLYTLINRQGVEIIRMEMNYEDCTYYVMSHKLVEIFLNLLKRMLVWLM